ncbi:MAG: hypothetical protein ABIH00_02515 [Armatimonadota bacterium]
MCKECGCPNHEELKDKPEKCTQEQIKKCHGDSKEHPCCGSEEKQE